MKNTYSILERNRIVEEHLWCIDSVMRKNHALIRAARLDYEEVYQQLALRLIRAVETFDPNKGVLRIHILAQLKYELLSCKTPRRLYGIIPLFLRKYQQKQIKQYRRREPIYKGMGDIICCLDESSSTEGEAAAWGKAVAMTLLEIAAESRRSFALIHFAGSSSCQVDIFRPGEYTLEDKLTAAETFLGGGTNFERPIREAIQLMDTEGFEKADVVFITDGECELPDACQQELQAAQVAYHFTVTGILLDEGQSGMDFSLKPFCQKIYRTSELTDNAVVQSVIGLLV